MTDSEPVTPFPLVIEGPLPQSPLPFIQPGLGFTLDAALYLSILDQIDDGVYFVDRQKRILLWNRGAERIRAYRQFRPAGDNCQGLRHSLRPVRQPDQIRQRP